MPPGISGPNKAEFDMQRKVQVENAQRNYVGQKTMEAVKNFNDAAALDQTWQLLYSSRDELAAVTKGKPRSASGDEGPSVTYDIQHAPECTVAAG